MWLWVQSIWIFAEWRISVTRKQPHPCSVHCSAGGVGRNIAHNGSAWSGCAFNISYWQRFYGETLLEETRRAGVNVSNCIRLHGHSTATYLAIANKQEETIPAINDTYSATANASTAQYFTGLDSPCWCGAG